MLRPVKKMMDMKTTRLPVSFLMVSAMLSAGTLHAAGQVSEVFTSEQPATPFLYDIDGQTYTWGASTNQVMDGFISGVHHYEYASRADRVQLRRDNIADVSTGNPCGVFVERQGNSSTLLRANYPSDGSGTGNCDMAEMISSRIINRGALNLFSNTGPHPKNVERVDYLFEHGVVAPMSQAALAQAGHVVAEKSGNNAIQIAAITSLDVFGQAASYGPLVRVNGSGCSGPEVCYGLTSLEHNYAFFQNNSLIPQGYPSFLKLSTESVGMAFVSAEQLGLSLGQRYYGFSYFPEDVDASLHTLTDPASFPDDTNDEHILFGDGADIYGGVSGHFVATSLSVASGGVFKDENNDGLFDSTEAGISNIGISLYQDVNGDNVLDQTVDRQLGESFESSRSGLFYLPGLSDGSYFLLLDNDDSDIPPGLSVAEGSNPLRFDVAGNDPDNLNFAFSSIDGSTTDGSTTDGSTTDGSTTDGSTTDGFVIIEDGSETRAVADSGVVNQDETLMLDVLSNDIDGPGDGLTIVSTSSSPNAVISIEAGQLVYKPNYGFIGQDNFLYVMQDSQGTQASGTVSVEVERYSDINNNGLNDFDECDCENLTLEVGVSGSALGGTSWLFMLCLSLAGVSRQYRLRLTRTAGAQA